MKSNQLALLLACGFACLPGMSTAGSSRARGGVLESVTETTIAILPGGGTVTTTRPLDVEQYALDHGLIAAPPTTQECDDDDTGGSGSGSPGESGGGSGTTPPPGDQYPSEPGPADVPDNVDQATRTNHYADGWTLSNTWGRTVTPQPGGGYLDGPWMETGRSSTPPGGGHPQDECPPHEEE
jgi:hypothetical protein